MIAEMLIKMERRPAIYMGRKCFVLPISGQHGGFLLEFENGEVHEEPVGYNDYALRFLDSDFSEYKWGRLQ